MRPRSVAARTRDTQRGLEAPTVASGDAGFTRQPPSDGAVRHPCGRGARGFSFRRRAAVSTSALARRPEQACTAARSRRALTADCESAAGPLRVAPVHTRATLGSSGSAMLARSMLHVVELSRGPDELGGCGDERGRARTGRSRGDHDLDGQRDRCAVGRSGRGRARQLDQGADGRASHGARARESRERRARCPDCRAWFLSTRADRKGWPNANAVCSTLACLRVG
jgi:hypothetical protein